MSVGCNLLVAATRLRHVATVAVHLPAAGTFLRSHRLARHSGQYWRCDDDEQEQSDESGEARHFRLIIRL